jgi:mannosyl-oligosaccharide alpha-1,2-mannosidase
MNLTSVAEAGTLQLELKYLAELTGNFTYWKRAEDVMRIIHRNPKTGGLVPMFLESAALSSAPRKRRLMTHTALRLDSLK